MGEPSCSFCKREACAFLPYAGKHFCQKHFKELFEKRVKRTIREFGMLRGVKRLGVAVSGGKDSLTTLHILAPIAKEMRIQVHAITIDEGIKGYRDELIEVAARECRKAGAKHHVVSFKKEAGFSLDKAAGLKKRQAACSYCGVLRRWLLNRKARELKLDKIAVGHNLDDAAQTILMNLLRNEPARLARFSPNGGVVKSAEFVDRIRPLFRTPEKEVALYALLKGIPVKMKGCPYAGEAFRNEARDFLDGMEEKYPGTKIRVVNSLLSAGKEGKESLPLEKCWKCGEPSAGRECKACEMIEEVRKRV